jgi:hypothetical protein
MTAMSEELDAGVRATQIERDREAIERDEAQLTRDLEKLEHDLADPHHGDHGQVDVVVNNQQVRLPHRRDTGLEIKTAAMEQGVRIDVGFQLWQEFPDGTERQVGDQDELTVRAGAVFSAIAPDDNS